jgi:hypothetical protein
MMTMVMTIDGLIPLECAENDYSFVIGTWIRNCLE